jgi:hypothetical protein
MKDQFIAWFQLSTGHILRFSRANGDRGSIQRRPILRSRFLNNSAANENYAMNNEGQIAVL